MHTSLPGCRPRLRFDRVIGKLGPIDQLEMQGCVVMDKTCHFLGPQKAGFSQLDQRTR